MVVKEHVLIWMSPDYTPLQWEEGRPVGLSFPDFFQTLVKSEKDDGVFPGLGAEDAVQIMAISDIFTALAEDRPYRSGMEAERIKTILQEQADRGFQDPRIIKLLFENMEEVRKAVKERQEQARYNYQVELEKSE